MASKCIKKDTILVDIQVELPNDILKYNDILSHGNALSPDGQKIVFTSDRDGPRNIYIMNSDGSNQQKLTDNPFNDYEPIFSPDGLSIIFTSERDGNKEI